MTRKSFLIFLGFILGTIVLATRMAAAADPPPSQSMKPAATSGTAFTYQGRLDDQGSPANSTYDFQFTLYDAANNGSQAGGPLVLEDEPVSDGYFSVELDFGAGPFNGQALWLEIGVRPGASNSSFDLLSPRQALTATPYALYSQITPWSGLSGIPGGFADGVDNDTTTFWSLTGNSGTNPSTNYLGTSDNQTLVLGVNASPALRLEPAGDTPNLIGGYSGNGTIIGVSGAVIAGGGANGAANFVTDDYGTVGGGELNQAGDNLSTTDTATFATVGGGYQNTASMFHSTIGGGYNNTASGQISTIGGGGNNIADGTGATIGGGLWNRASQIDATIGGGYNNDVSEQAAVISGGTGNSNAGSWATIGGGALNIITGTKSTIAGGYSNVISATYASLGGGLSNNINGHYATVGGGSNNDASGVYATIPGGGYNLATGEYSFAAGRRARAIHNGAFVWADDNRFIFSSTQDNMFLARATNGFQLVAGITSFGGISWSCSFQNGGSWACSSDRAMKENFQSVDSQVLLEKLARLPVQTWNARGTDPEVKHLGPTAQDFYAAFGLGDSDKTIHTIDLDGVSLVAIQGLYHLSLEKDARITELDSQAAQQQTQIEALEARLDTLESGGQISRPWSPGIRIWFWLGLFLLGAALAWLAKGSMPSLPRTG